MQQQNVEFNNYSKPTPVQQYSIPISMAGRDIMACAQTGSGKTAAFTFPVLYCLLKKGQPSNSGRRAMPSALALAPTRELAIQIQEESSKFSFRCGLRTYNDPYYATQCHIQLLPLCDLV